MRDSSQYTSVDSNYYSLKMMKRLVQFNEEVQYYENSQREYGHHDDSIDDEDEIDRKFRMYFKCPEDKSKDK